MCTLAATVALWEHAEDMGLSSSTVEQVQGDYSSLDHSSSHNPV